jgi:hypothetical protein
MMYLALPGIVYILGVVLTGVIHAWMTGDDEGEWWLLLLAYGWPLVVAFVVVANLVWMPIQFGLWLGVASMAKPKPEPER